jgi:hypothetical protein
LHVFGLWLLESGDLMLLLEFLLGGDLTAFKKRMVFICKHANTACQQVNVVVAFFKNNFCCLGAVPFIVGVDDNQLVGFIFELRELAENGVLLDVHCWKVDCVHNVPFAVLRLLSKVQQQNFRALALCRRQRVQVPALSHDFLGYQKAVGPCDVKLTFSQELGESIGR